MLHPNKLKKNSSGERDMTPLEQSEHHFRLMDKENESLKVDIDELKKQLQDLSKDHNALDQESEAQKKEIERLFTEIETLTNDKELYRIVLKGKKCELHFQPFFTALNNMMKGQVTQYRSAPNVHNFVAKFLSIEQEEARELFLNWDFSQ